MRRATATLFLFAATWLAAAPAFALFDDEEARRRIDVLRQEMTENQRQVAEQLKKLDATVSSASDRSALLQISTQVETLNNELARMRGQLETLTNQAETADRRQKDLYLDIDTRLRKLEQSREQAAIAPPTSATSPEAEASPAEMRAYQAALDQFKLGNYSLAVSAMQGFLVTYPSSKLAANAQYWVGMAYSGQRDYKQAISAQRKLLSGWPESDKAPDAMLSIASSQETMGERKNAQKTLEDLVTKYPKSSAAASAKQRLAAFSKR
ncbi:MAG TPA: tol-pal system protein YbgF [Burkholderiales bacterium]|jgi:tol-pal system protein YbgF|nr:tol-pal system protein YbgF [Burkholderiales bacterium]